MYRYYSNVRNKATDFNIGMILMVSKTDGQQLGSCCCGLIDKIHIPQHFIDMVRSYFSEIHLRFTTSAFCKVQITCYLKKGKITKKLQLLIWYETIPSIINNPTKCLGKWFGESIGYKVTIGRIEQQALVMKHMKDTTKYQGRRQ